MPKEWGKPSVQELMDLRIAERNLKRGLITEEDYRKFISKLPDLKDRCEPVRIQLPNIGESLQIKAKQAKTEQEQTGPEAEKEEREEED